MPHDYFGATPLSAAQVGEYRLQGVEIAMDLATTAKLTGGPLQWQLLAKSSTYQLYKATSPTGAAGGTLFCGTTQVVGTIDEVAALFRADTTEAAKARCQNHQLMDTVVLHSIVRPSEMHPNESVSVVWRAYESPLGAVFQNRDSCVLMSQREFASNSRRGWVCALQSIELNACPDLESALGFVRVQNYGSGHVVIESEDRPGYLDVTYVSHADLGAGKSEWFLNQVLHRKQWLTDMAMRKRCQNVVDIDRILRQQRLVNSRFVTNFVALDSRRGCFVCQKRFHLLHRKKANCTKCGEVVCAKCCRAWSINGVRLKVCTVCSAPGATCLVVAEVPRPPDEKVTTDALVCYDPWRIHDSTVLADSEFEQWLTTMERVWEREQPATPKPSAHTTYCVEATF